MNNCKIFTRDWPESGREDIRHANRAEELGFTLMTSYRFKDGTEIPHNCLSFKKRNTTIWLSVKDVPHWRAADEVNGRYINHRSFKWLIDALLTEN